MRPGGSFLAGAAAALSTVVRTYGIAVEFQPSLRLEEHAPALGDGLLEGLHEHALERLQERMERERIDWLPFEEVLEGRARSLKAEDFAFGTEAVNVTLGETSTLELRATRSVLLRGVVLSLAGGTLGQSQCSIVLGTEPRPVELPDVPVRHWTALQGAGGKLEIALLLGAEARTVAMRPMRFLLPALDGPPRALMVDLGSTMTKMLRLTLPSAGGADENWSAALRRRLEEAAQRPLGTDNLNIIEPQPTETFLADRRLPAFDKARLDAASPEELARWLGAAIRGFAQLAARQERSLVTHVYWSFPQTGTRDFTELNRAVNAAASAFVLDGITIVPEHDCLRRRFAGVLENLARVARARRREKKNARQLNKQRRNAHENDVRGYEEAKEKYEGTFWPLKIFKKAPNPPGALTEAPVPELEEWHRAFLELRVQKDLNEVLILDAGGYSLDVFARARRGTRVQDFMGSFAAGGVTMTQRVRELLAEERGCAPGEIAWSEAENLKCETCAGEQHRWLQETCRQLTAEIYTPALRAVAAWLQERTGSRGLPLVLSGGAMTNIHLRELLRQTLDEHGFHSASTNSFDLVQLIAQQPAAERERLAIFSGVACAFGPVANARLQNDIIGGLVEVALEDGAA